MKRYFVKAFGVMLLAGAIASTGFAQNKKSEKLEENERVVIKKTGDKKTKVTVEINNGEVKVNGKPLSDFNDENVSVEIEGDVIVRGYGPARSPFRASERIVFDNSHDAMAYSSDSNKPLLGVMSDDHADGAKITAVTKGSAAEKAGLKAGDVITRINETKVENAKQLTEVVGKFKPDEKVKIAIKRDNKNQNLTATLGKRTGTQVWRSNDMNPGNFNFDDFRMNGVTSFGSNQGRLGIKAQDTEDEKGVKVLSVDPESHAAKSGIKEGDIIYQFDGEEVNSATELAEVAREAREKNTIKVRIGRDGKSQDIDIKIPKKLKTANL